MGKYDVAAKTGGDEVSSESLHWNGINNLSN